MKPSEIRHIVPAPPAAIPKPPKHLSVAMKRWWRDVARTYKLDPHHLLLLTQACTCLDNCEAARAELAKAGRYYTDAHGVVRAHPAVQGEINSRNGFLKSLKALELDISVPGPVGRPGGGVGVTPKRG